MKLYKMTSKIPEYVYHGSHKLFDNFDTSMTAQGILWFADDPKDIIEGNSGAVSNQYIYKVKLNVSNPAGWEEYDKLFLDQIRQNFDSIELDGYWVVFDPNNVEIVSVLEKTDDGYEKIR